MEIIAFFLITSVVIKFFKAIDIGGSNPTEEPKSQEEISGNIDDGIEFIKNTVAVIVIGAIICGFISLGKYAFIVLAVLILLRLLNPELKRRNIIKT